MKKRMRGWYAWTKKKAAHRCLRCVLLKLQYYLVAAGAEAAAASFLAAGAFAFIAFGAASALAAGAAVTITVTEGCNGTGVEGLLAADLVFKNSSGVTQVPTGVTDNGNGSYTAAFSPSLGAGTYSVNLSADTIEISGSSAIYGKLPTAKSFTI